MEFALKTILVPLDFSDVTDAVVKTTGQLANGMNASLRFLHVEPSDPEFVGYDPGPQTVRDHVAEDYRRGHRRLQAIGEKLKQDGFRVTTLLVQGPPAEKILHEAERAACDLIIMGSHGHGALYHLGLPLSNGGNDFPIDEGSHRLAEQSVFLLR